MKTRDNRWLVPGLVGHPAFVFAVSFVAIFLLHVPLLQLPYFWDEAGYYVPAARDLLLSGSLIPRTTVSNAHPPLVLAWIALWWKCVGYAPVVTRSAMLVVAAFSLLGIFRLAERVANVQVAIASTVCTALYPVFFAQSSLAQVDLAAAGLTFWGLWAYLEDRPVATAIWFSLAALAKETAILAPAGLAAWEGLRFVVPQRFVQQFWDSDVRGSSAAWARRILPLLVPVLPLALWLAYHYARTGYVFGNPEFFRYNVAATQNPLRFILALGLRLWQAFGYLHLWVLTLGMLLAMLWPPLKDDGVERQRITIPVQMIFLVVVKVYVVAMALIGGAVLARYMLPAVPLVIIVAVSTLRRRLRYWPAAVAIVAVAFVAAWFWNPPYGFSPEDNLAYRDYIVLHQDGERFLEARYPMAHLLTAWPASDELTRPWLGYTTRPVQVVRIEDFSLEQVLSAADFRARFEVALVFSTKYEPAHPLLDRWQKWTDWKRRFFGYHRDLPPEAAARILGGTVVFTEERKGQWIAVIEMEPMQQMEDAGAADSGSRLQARSSSPISQLRSAPHR
ncbi:MAG: ArnT family glycosyltransferase [Candidatus Sulfotelmatobacter sp.]